MLRHAAWRIDATEPDLNLLAFVRLFCERYCAPGLEGRTVFSTVGAIELTFHAPFPQLRVWVTDGTQAGTLIVSEADEVHAEAVYEALEAHYGMDAVDLTWTDGATSRHWR